MKIEYTSGNNLVKNEHIRTNQMHGSEKRIYLQFLQAVGSYQTSNFFQNTY